MAFQSVTGNSKTVKTSELKEGGEIVGFVTGIRTGVGQFNSNVIDMMSEDKSERFSVYPSGTINWAIKDGKVELGMLTKIVRNGEYTIKSNGKKIASFEILQDSEATIPVSPANLSAAESTKAKALGGDV
jgi:hypothetical protein